MFVIFLLLAQLWFRKPTLTEKRRKCHKNRRTERKKWTILSLHSVFGQTPPTKHQTSRQVEECTSCTVFWDQSWSGGLTARFAVDVSFPMKGSLSAVWCTWWGAFVSVSWLTEGTRGPLGSGAGNAVWGKQNTCCTTAWANSGQDSSVQQHLKDKGHSLPRDRWLQ